jgi:chromosome segregation ATPase
MNRRLCAALAIIGSLFLLQGCVGTDTNDLRPRLKSAKSEIARLESELTAARERIAREEKAAQTLAAELDSMRNELAQVKMRAQRGEAARKAADKRREQTEKADMSKIGLLGAKALAEYRAKKLSERLDVLKKDLEKKEKELSRIRQEAQAKDREVAALGKRVEEFRQGQQTRAAELANRLEAMNREIAARSEESQRLKNELDDKTGLLQTLKNAAADSSRLKADAEQKIVELKAQLIETEKRLQAELGEKNSRLQARLAEAEKATEAARNDAKVCRQETEQLKSTVERWRKEIQAINVEADRLRKDRDHFATAAAKARVELERRDAETKQLRDLIAEMSAKLEAGEQSASASVPEAGPEAAPARDLPSTVDRILKPPGAERTREQMTDLY